MNCIVCEKTKEYERGFERICQSCWFDLPQPLRKKWWKQTINGRYAPNSEFTEELRAHIKEANGK